MNLLLDACTFIWSATEPSKLSPTALVLIEDSSNPLFLSPVSIWEMCVKYAAGKLVLKPSAAEFIEIQSLKLAVRTLPFDDKAALKILTLPPIHKDPFDRMLVCQTLAQNLTILTPDTLIRQYAVSSHW